MPVMPTATFASDCENIIIVVPVYFDTESFGLLYQNLLTTISRQKSPQTSSVNFLVIDDSGGFDPDINKLRELLSVTVLTTPYNLGHQKALVWGLRSISEHVKDNDIVVTMDSDGQDAPDDLSSMLQAVVNNKENNPVVIARRTKRQEALSFKMLYFFYKLLFRFLTGTLIKSGNYACYYGKFLKQIIHHPYFDLCYSSTIVAIVEKPIFVPCARARRYRGKSKMDIFRLAKHGLDMLMPFLDKIATRFLIGFAGIFTSALFATLVVIIIKLGTKLAIPGWASYTVLALLILSIVSLGNFLVLFSLFSYSQGNILEVLGKANELSRTSSKTAN